MKALIRYRTEDEKMAQERVIREEWYRYWGKGIDIVYREAKAFLYLEDIMGSSQILMIANMTSLGRKLTEIFENILWLKGRGFRLIVLEGAIDLRPPYFDQKSRQFLDTIQELDKANKNLIGYYLPRVPKGKPKGARHSKLDNYKSYVVYLRNEGMSYQGIADKLESQHNVVVSRQSVEHFLKKKEQNVNFFRRFVLFSCRDN